MIRLDDLYDGRSATPAALYLGTLVTALALATAHWSGVMPCTSASGRAHLPPPSSPVSPFRFGCLFWPHPMYGFIYNKVPKNTSHHSPRLVA